MASAGAGGGAGKGEAAMAKLGSVARAVGSKAKELHSKAAETSAYQKAAEVGGSAVGAVKASSAFAKASSAWEKVSPEVSKQFRRMMPVDLLDFLKDPSVEKLQANPAILLSTLSVLAMMKNPARIPLQMALSGGMSYAIDAVKKSPQAIRAAEEVKMQAISHAMAQATAGTFVNGVDLPPDMLRVVAQNVDLGTVVQVVQGANPSADDLQKLAKLLL